MLTNCSLDNDQTNDYDQVFKQEWHLVGIEGGLSETSETFDLEVIIWSFDDNNNLLTVNNNNNDDTKEDFLDSGTYSYDIIEESGNKFFAFNGIEYGQYTFLSTDVLVVDGNKLSTGTGADGFVYTFNRVLIPID